MAGLAAGKQNLFWQYTELFYHEQGQEDTGYVNEAYLTGLAQQIHWPEPDQVAGGPARLESVRPGRLG